MKEIYGRFIGSPEKFRFEQRIFNFALLLGIIMTFFGTIMDVYYRASILADIIFTGCWILAYYLSRFRDCFSTVSVVSTGVFVFAFIPYTWIYSGGSGSILPYYTIVFIAIISIILSGAFRRVMVFSMLSVELLLICRDAYNAGSFAEVFNRNMKYVDFFVQILVIMAVMAVLIIVYSNTYMNEKSRSEAYARTIAEQYRQQLYYMENLEQLNYRLKSERHDFNNHLGVIYGLLESGETDKAGSYAKHLVKTAEEYRSIVNIPYSMLRAMLNYKLSAAREKGIELRLNVNLPEKLLLNEFDIAVILGNLLDNAVEACASNDENKRHISLELLYQPDYLIIQVENPVKVKSEFQTGEKWTTKPDHENHGFGLSNIGYLVNKHNGLMKIESENDAFKVSIALIVDLNPS